MSEVPNPPDVSERLARLEAGVSGSPVTATRRSPLTALLVVVLIGLAGTVLYLLNQPEEEVALPTATPDEFQPEGDGFGTIEPFVPPAPPEPEVVEIPAETPEPNAELLAQIAALQAQIEAIQNAPDPVVEEDAAAAEAMNALTAQLADLQAASEAAQQQFVDELEARDRELQQLRIDLDLARLEAQQSTPAPLGPTDEELRLREEERLRREEEARRLADLQRRAEEERAFQERRILSPLIAFGGATGGAEGTELAERTFSEVSDFVLNGAFPSPVTQSESHREPVRTPCIQGTVIQAALETAIIERAGGPGSRHYIGERLQL